MRWLIVATCALGQGAIKVDTSEPTSAPTAAPTPDPDFLSFGTPAPTPAFRLDYVGELVVGFNDLVVGVITNSTVVNGQSNVENALVAFTQAFRMGFKVPFGAV